MILYVVGPSGVGKSNAMKALRASHGSIRIVDLDEACTDHWFDWPFVRSVLQGVHQETKPGDQVVVDVGAGIQTLPNLRAFVALHRAEILLVTAPADEVIHRQPVMGRPMDEFVDTEYTRRRDLYSAARRIVDVSGLSQEASARLVVVAVLEQLFAVDESP